MKVTAHHLAVLLTAFQAVFLALLLMCGCSAGPQPLTGTDTPAPETTSAPAQGSLPTETPLPHSVKGWELYSWQADGEWFFTLITGTNRNKTIEEITSDEDTLTGGGLFKITVQGVKAVESVLSKLPAGESIFWFGGYGPAPAPFEGTSLTLPPPEMVNAVQEHCRRRGLELRVSAQAHSQRLRVANRSAIPLQDLVVIFPDDRVEFGDVPPGTTTGYQEAPHGVYRYAAYNVEVDGRQYEQPVIDWVGESPMQGEAFIYILEADPSRWETEGQVIRLVEVIQDPGTGSPSPPAPTEVSQPTPRESPLMLPAGLTVEEYALKEPPIAEPLHFSPLQGSQAGILAKHASERRAHFGSNSFFDQMHYSMRVKLGEDELVARENYNQTGSEGWVTVSRGGEEIYRIGAGPGSPINALRGLWVYEDLWVLETASITLREEGDTVFTDAVGQISQDGELLNDRFGYEEMFGFQLIAGKPFYFFKQDGLIGFSYDGQIVESGYEEIPHYGCCSAGALNPVQARDMVAFFAQRDGVWYYVEIGAYADSPDPAQTPAPTPSSPAETAFFPSPDGQWTAVLNREAGSLEVEDAQGMTHAVFPAGSTVSATSWSPDSSRLIVALSSTPVPVRSPEETGIAEIWMVAVTGSGLSEPRLIRAPEPSDEDAGAWITFGAWSPDSRRVLFWPGPLSASIQADGLPLWSLEVETGKVTRLAETALMNPAYQSWAADGSALVFTNGGYRSAQVNKWLSLYDVESGQVRPLVAGSALIPGAVAWSPAGEVIAFAAVRESQTGDEWADWMSWDNPAIQARRIYLLNLQTGEYRRLNAAEAYQDAPRWSADGAELYHVQNDGDQALLMAADPASGEARPLPGCQVPQPDGAGYYGQVDWSGLYAACTVLCVVK